MSPHHHLPPKHKNDDNNTETHKKKGNSKPRIISNLESALPPTTSTKANTSKPRATKNNGSKVAGGRVTKAKSGTTATPTTSATATAKKDKPSANVKTVKKPRTKTEKAVDSVVGTAEKVVGDLQGKPGKKVCCFCNPLLSLLS